MTKNYSYYALTMMQAAVLLDYQQSQHTGQLSSQLKLRTKHKITTKSSDQRSTITWQLTHV